MISIVAKVVHGKALGRTMGFATANQDTSQIKECPDLPCRFAEVVQID